MTLTDDEFIQQSVEATMTALFMYFPEHRHPALIEKIQAELNMARPPTEAPPIARRVLVAGSPGDGFTFYGPLEQDVASNLSSDDLEDVCGSDEPWWIAELVPFPIPDACSYCVGGGCKTCGFTGYVGEDEHAVPQA